MSKVLMAQIQQRLSELQQSGLFKAEHPLTSAQAAEITLANQAQVLNLCANNYLGLANHPEIISAAEAALRTAGFGLASVRFICGTQTLHQQLESALSQFLQKDDTILFSSCFDANGGLFEALFGQDDVIMSDALNHASLIDGIRLCKATRQVYAHGDITALEQHLQAAQGARARVIVTDGVFSMDGSLANLPALCALADQYDALLVVDDSHGFGVMGESGRGTPEHYHCLQRIDLITGTFGKALGGASGGFVSGAAPLIQWLRQRARPYLFSNTLAPMIVAATLKALALLQAQPELRVQLHDNTQYFREALVAAGFTVLPGKHPIVPIMLKDAKLASRFAEALLARDIYAVGFSYPVVPEDAARIRVQISSAHSRTQLAQAVEVFKEVGAQLNVINL